MKMNKTIAVTLPTHSPPSHPTSKQAHVSPRLIWSGGPFRFSPEASLPPSGTSMVNLLDKQTSRDTEGAGIWGILLVPFPTSKLVKNPPVSLVPPVSLIVGFPEGGL